MSSSSQTPARATSSIPLSIPDIVQRYRDGETVAELARESKRSRYVLWQWMLAGIGDHGHEQIVTECLVNRIADADELLETASSGLELARAREKAKLSRLDFERRRPKLYGAQPQTQHNTAITVVIQRDGSGQNGPVSLQATIEAEGCLEK